MPTGIPYCDEVWNVCCGCTPIASGCKFCWSERLHDMRHKAWFAKMGGWTNCPKQYWKPFSTVQLLPERLEQPLHWRKPRTIFVNSMSDTWHKAVPFEFIDDILRAMRQAERHTYLLFTKRWERALDWYSSTTRGNRYFIRDYVRLYFSASTQAEVDEAVPILLQIPAAVRGLSLEPCIAPIDLEMTRHALGAPPCDPGRFLKNSTIASIIVGCESGPNRRPCEIEWIRSIVNQCQEASVPVYVKQISVNGRVTSKMNDFPKDLQMRKF